MRLRPIVYPQWEITDLKEVAPIPVHYDSDDGMSATLTSSAVGTDLTPFLDLEIYQLASRPVTGTYTFDASDSKFRPDQAVTHARTRLLEEVSNSSQYNFLVNEG